MVSLTRNPCITSSSMHKPACTHTGFQEDPVHLQGLDFALSQPAQNILLQDLILDLLMILAALQTVGVPYCVS